MTSKNRVRGIDLNGEVNRVRKKHNRAIIAADVRRFCHQISDRDRAAFPLNAALTSLDLRWFR
jgi:hypothetical protein